MIVLLFFIFFLHHLSDSPEPTFAQGKETQSVAVYFPNRLKDPESIECGKGFPVARRLKGTLSLRDSIRLTLKELLKGPTAIEETLGYRRTVPSPLEIRRHIKQQHEYAIQNPKAQLNKQFWIVEHDTVVYVKRLKVVRDSVFVEFSKSMIAYGGGSCRVASILGPIGQTILQFPTITRIGFWIEGTPKGELPFQP